MAKAGKWTQRKTFWITILCGLGHVGSSIVLGMLGLALGLAVQKLNGFENFRGNLAGWALIMFGLVYFAWGINRAYRNKPHTHIHSHGEDPHVHQHTHQEEHCISIPLREKGFHDTLDFIYRLSLWAL